LAREPLGITLRRSASTLGLKAPKPAQRAEFLGRVEAPDRAAAEAAAAERFNLTEEQRRRLVLQEQLPR
jgi:hypothetical protein